MPIEIGELLDHGPWPRFAKLATLLFAIAIIFDGFDISIVGFAVPSIIQDWHLPRASFAPLLVIGLLGMMVGSAIAGFIGDRIGRRAALSLSVLLFGVGVAASAFAPNLLTIEVLRFIAACGIGGALPNAATMSGEFTPIKMRTVAVMSTIICVPLGAALAGSVAGVVVPLGGWRALFFIGGILPILLSFVMFWLVPESPRFLARHPERAPELVRLLGRLGHAVPPDATFIESASQTAAPSLTDFFGPRRALSTLSLWLTFFASGASVYLCLSWLPSLLSARQLGSAVSIEGLEAWNYGGFIGVVGFVLLVNRLGSRILTLTACLGAVVSALLLVTMGVKQGVNAPLLLTALAAHGFFVNALQTSLFALGVYLYPTRVRARGVAVASAMTRLGGILSASLGSWLIQLGSDQFFEYLMAAMLIAFVGMALLRNHIPKVEPKTLPVAA
jgi:AAHS family 4-hydroxybenzoate transporter-like MFS transporter